MNYNFRKKDTLEIFNERWEVNHKKINVNKLKNNLLRQNTPTNQVKRITNNVNYLNKINNNKFISKIK